jgi:hypothetical protein
MTAYLGRSNATLLEVMQQVADIDTTRHGSAIVKSSLKGLQDTNWRDRPQITCYMCGQNGHVSRKCPLSDDIRKLVEEKGKEPEKQTRREPAKIESSTPGKGRSTNATRPPSTPRWRRGALKVTKEVDSEVDLGGKVESGSEAESISSFESGSGKGRGRR